MPRTGTISARVGIFEADRQASVARLDNTDAVSTLSLLVRAAQAAYNGSGFDLLRDNILATVLALAARTSTTSSPDQTNFNARGVTLVVNVTAVSGTTPTLSVRIDTQDSLDVSVYFALNVAPADITATGQYVYVVYPGASGGNVTQVTPLPLPRVWRARGIIGGTTPSFTFSFSGQYTL